MTEFPSATPPHPPHPPRPLRLLVVMPSWIGDAVMATPALRLARSALPGSFIGGLLRPGLDELLAGSDFFDHVHVGRAEGVMGPKRIASGLRPVRYDTALLLTNSFSTALIARLAWIPRRIGYDRDGRGLLLTDRLAVPRRARPYRGWAPVPAVEYYLEAARAAIGGTGGGTPRAPRPELFTTPEEERAADEALSRGGMAPGTRFAVVNPGGNNPAKRWPGVRFAAVGKHLSERHGLALVLNGAPAERGLVVEIAAAIGAAPTPVLALPDLGVTLGLLKAVVRRASLMVTNDTGPRHIAAAFGVPTVALFGPTDPRWTALPPEADGSVREVVLAADPTLPPEEVADDHPDRCRIDRIGVEAVLEACDRLVGRV